MHNIRSEFFPHLNATVHYKPIPALERVREAFVDLWHNKMGYRVNERKPHQTPENYVLWFRDRHPVTFEILDTE